ncbi:Peptidoglycan-binding lysin domain protein [Geobacter metallireducens RCH3]|uniref:LysM domain protein n=1 Tax=Geobacter metallireducens (strain ATCC 53774 / DSM 7210 / GS-15) TaxID=269799 RepID=Q39QN5_GEOMG|nr:LysM peptidoglycan-binding domain-containing protein [Geobacter metallireducens]ABB33439.1 LysM domain protein [Geobacter metallireducens GS-15]EHP87492.1 Peptidoglycan-binding lysin domain protein [Geobacter metallireducens RCH3]
MNGTLRLVASSLVLSLASLSSASGAEYLRYAPEPSDGKPLAGPEEGVLVERITIEKGDTLYGLSRKYSGKGTYFSQILLFNEIANPNLIYAGHKLLVPLPPGHGEETAAPTRRAKPAEKRKGARKHQAVTPASKEAKPVVKLPAATTRPSSPPRASEVPASKAVSPSPATRKGGENEQTLFEKGVSAYKSGQYQQSLDAFDRFLARYPESPLAPDASLYRADALMKMAGQ